MDTLFSRLLTQVYELEGLLLVVDKHGEETPQVVYHRIGELGAEIAQRSQQLSCKTAAEPQPLATAEPEPQPVAEPEPQPVAEPEPAIEPVPVAEPDPVAEPEIVDEPEQPADELPDKDYNADETWQHDNGEEFKEVFKIDYVEPQSSPLNEEQTATVDPVPDTVVETEQCSEPAGTDLRVDEKLQRTLSKDMHKALSLNDRYRFMRELFSNSKNDMNNALDLINVMQSYDEAEEYFIHDLGWDQDNEDVADFMGLVRKHFL